MYENSVKEKVGDVNFIGISVFFPPLSCLPFPALLLFFSIAWSDFKAHGGREIIVYTGHLVQNIATVYIHPVVYI